MRKNSRYIYLSLIVIIFMIGNTAYAQKKAFTGTVTNSSGNPVQGVELTIMEQPGEKYFTDSNGKFTLIAESGLHLMVRTLTNEGKVVVIDQINMSIVLDHLSRLLNIGYGQTVFQNELSSSLSTVDADQISRSSALNPENALYGLLPGLSVMQNGGIAEGRNPDMFIRGNETMNNANILVLVDGFERPLSSLSTAEIQTATVLKDAAALAIYGKRGANGVLLITTKRGQNNALKVDVSYQYGMNQAFRLPEFFGANDYANALNEALTNDGLPVRYNNADLAAFKSGDSPYLFPNVNWNKEVLRDFGTNSNFNTTFTGGGDHIKYFTSLNYQNEMGLFNHTDNNIFSTQQKYTRLNFRTNLDIDLTKNTLFRINVGGNIYDANRPGTSADNIFNALYSVPSAAFPVKTLNSIWGGTNIYNNNPMALATATGYATTHSRTLLFDVSVKQNLDKIVNGLSAEIAVSYDNAATFWDGKTKNFKYQITDIQHDATGAITSPIYTSYGLETALAPYSQLGGQWRHGNFWGKLNYYTYWGQNTLNAMVLYQQDKKVDNGQYHTYLHQSMVGNANYNYAQKYYAALSVSYSGGNFLPANDRFGFFPAISGAWLLNKEQFLADSKAIKLLKVRTSWGITGNDLMSPNLADQGYNTSGGYYFTNNNTATGGFREGTLATQQLTYEKSYKTNIGIDANIWGKLDATLDAFYDKRNDILVTTAGKISSVLGVTPQFQNLGITSNKGIEASLNWKDQIGSLNYHFGGQLSFTRNKVIEMAESYQPLDYLKRTGNPIGQVFGMQVIGFFKDQNDVSTSPRQLFSTVKPGDFKYKDQNGDNLINELDNVPLGYNTSYPEIYYSFNLGFNYKGFGIDAVFQGTAHQSVYLNTPSVFWPLSGNKTISSFSDNHWTPTTSNSATLPRLTTLNSDNNFRSNSTWIENGSYLKLRTAEVYYELPKKSIEKFKLNKARLFVRGMDLFSIDKVKVMDPEEIGTGYPTLRTFYLGVNVAF
ncbi:MAG: SusC/RagA family TonB-linked outer membrane protein [Mariniphaga sp.]